MPKPMDQGRSGSSLDERSRGVSGAAVESVTKRRRRTFTAADKLRIVKQADAYLASGERGAVEALMRKEGIYSSLRASVDSALRDTGLSGPQHGTMLVLAAQPGTSNATLARVCFVTPQTMNEIVRGLENAELVERVEAEDGGREIALRLTEEGRRRLAAGEKRVVEVEAAALAAR